MPIREECKHFQSRTYNSGEVARFCVLDLAPEAPWRCPDDCSQYARRTADVAWTHGSLVEPAIEEEPAVASGDVAELLDQAEGIVNAVVPEVRAEVEQIRRAQERGSWVQRLRRRRGGPSTNGGSRR